MELKLAFHMRAGTWRSHDPIRGALLREHRPHRMLTHEPEDYSDRCHQPVEHNTEKNPRIDPSQHVPNPHPSCVNGPQDERERGAKKNKNPTRPDCPPTQRLAVKDERPQPNHNEYTADHQPKLAQFPGCC